MTDKNHWKPPPELINPAMKELVRMAGKRLLPGPVDGLEVAGFDVLGIRAADVTHFLILSEAGRTFLSWLPEGNRRAMALREALAASGWLLTRPDGTLMLADRPLNGRRYAAVLFVLKKAPKPVR